MFEIDVNMFFYLALSIDSSPLCRHEHGCVVHHFFHYIVMTINVTENIVPDEPYEYLIP